MGSASDDVQQTSESGRVHGGWLGDETRFWRVAATGLGAMAVLKGLRRPSMWAATQAQLDYSHGFIKRGLLGAVYGPLGGDHYGRLSWIFAAELGVFLLLLGLLTWRSRLEERFGGLAVAALFSSSYAVTYITHLIGYNDIVNASLAMALLLVRDAGRRFVAALVVVPVALLIHEGFLLCFLPVVLLSFLVGTEDGQRGRRWSYAALLTGLAVGVTLLSSRHSNMTWQQAMQFADEVTARVDFPVRRDVFFVPATSLHDNLRAVFRCMQQRWWWMLLGLSLVVMLPMAAMLVHLTRRLAWGAAMGAARRRWTLAAALAAGLCPLGMHVLGWDVVRWNAVCALSIYLAMLVLAMHLPAGRTVLTGAERHTMVLLLAVNLASGYGLFDGATVTPYPFYPALCPGWFT